MKELFQKGLFAGLGLLEVTRKEGEEILNMLVEKGKLSADDAEAVVKEFAGKSAETAKSVEKSMADLFESFLDKAPFVRKEEFAALKLRVEKLEETAKKKPAARKNTKKSAK